MKYNGICNSAIQDRERLPICTSARLGEIRVMCPIPDDRNWSNYPLRRQLHFEKTDGTVGQAELTIEWPVNNGSEWECRYTLFGLPFISPSQGHIFGEDAIQSLLLCISFLKNQFEDAANNGISIWWMDPNDLGGLKVL